MTRGAPDISSWPPLDGTPGFYRWAMPHAYEADPENGARAIWQQMSDDRLQAM